MDARSHEHPGWNVLRKGRRVSVESATEGRGAMAEQIDPDAEPKEGADTSKPFGELAKDAAYNLKEDAKDAVRRTGDEEDEDDQDEDGASKENEG